MQFAQGYSSVKWRLNSFQFPLAVSVFRNQWSPSEAFYLGYARDRPRPKQPFFQLI